MSPKARWAQRAGRFRIFRYEIRCWRGGHIPDVAEAVDSPRRLTDEGTGRRMLDLVAQVPTPVWGRDELGTGEMWNSNSVIAWVIARSGIDTESIQPPTGGRAPGWHAGLAVAHRYQYPTLLLPPQAPTPGPPRLGSGSEGRTRTAGGPQAAA